MGAPLAEAWVFFSILAFMAFLIWNRSRVTLERRRLELDAQTRMLERIGPGQALTDFLQTHEGKQFFAQLTVSGSTSTGSKDTRTRIFVLTTLGLIAMFAGFFLVMGFLIPSFLSRVPGSPAGGGFMTVLPVFVLSGAGAGALIAAWLMHRLSKKWGMLESKALDAGAK